MTKDNEGRILETRPVTPEDIRPLGWRDANKALQRWHLPPVTLPPLKWLDEGEPDA